MSLTTLAHKSKILFAFLPPFDFLSTDMNTKNPHMVVRIFCVCGLEQNGLRRKQSVTSIDEMAMIELDAITDDQRSMLLGAILSDESLDQWSAANDNSESLASAA
jgi:hypothetical protein